MNAVWFTESARWQLREAVQSIGRRSPTQASAFRDRPEHLIRNREGLEAEGRALPEFLDVPFREILIEGYRVFFRAESDTLWIAGIWNVDRSRRA